MRLRKYTDFQGDPQFMSTHWKELEKERLHHAASAGDIEQIKALLDEGLPINAFDSLDCTPLHCADIAGHIEAVQFLIDAGADVNAHDEEKNPARLRSGKSPRTAPSIWRRFWLTLVPILRS